MPRPSPPATPTLALCLCFAVAGCGSAAPTVPAFPQVVSQGGPTLTHATLVPVSFPGDSLAPVALDFTAKLPQSTYWSLWGEYGIGSATTAPPVATTLTLPASVDDTFWQSTLPALIEQGQQGFTGPPPPQAIYILYLPLNVIATAQQQIGCIDFGGYHSSVKLADGTQVAYVLVPRCQTFNGLSGQDSLTGVASHEILETASDPYANPAVGQGAFADVDPTDAAFSLVFGGEIGDLCLNSLPAFFTPTDLPYIVQRLWSNAAAKRGEDPCLPAASGAFVQSIPQISSVLTFNINGTQRQIRALAIPVGQSATVDVQLYSPGSTQSFNVSVLPLNDGIVAATFDKSSGVDGEILHLQLSVTQPGILHGTANLEAVAIVSRQGDRAAAWPILISNP